MRVRIVAFAAALIAIAGTLLIAIPSQAATPESIFGTTVPSVKADPDAARVELGVQFKAAVAGQVTGVRFYKGSGNTGTHTGSLWSSTGSRLATANFTGETSSGWQSVTFATPVNVAAGTTYVASYLARRGHYAVDDPYTFPHVSGDLTAVKGTYLYGGGFPSQVYQTSNYWVDVSFTPSAVATTTTPTIPTTVSTTPVSTTPTTTTTTASGCAGTPNTPSGADPFGGCWPGPSNTGVPAGTTLTAYTGPATVTTAGTVIDSKLVTACLNIAANNVTIKNSLLQSNGCFFNVLNNSGNTGLQLTDVEIDGQVNSTGDSSIGGDDYTCLRCNIHGTGDGAKAGTGVVFQDSWIHDEVITSTSHNDGIQSLGTTSLTITHNTIIVKNGGNSSVTLSTGVASDMRNVLMQRNLFGGGGYTVYGGYQAGVDVLSRVSNIQILGNYFTTVIHPNSGAFGPFTSVSPPVVVSGNVWADGPNAGTPVG